MSWIVTGILTLIVSLIIWTEMRHERRNKRFHKKMDPEVEALRDHVVLKYRERFGKDPTLEFPRLHNIPDHHTAGSKKS